ncbi:MAG: FMN-binding protein [Lentisphaerales bacterium]|jgi:Na+-transporting NADH:ubiquinone oxidoreductase subunit NqrC|nr:MAG: FMN-binding protein [Lentisphaerales bacterium]
MKERITMIIFILVLGGAWATTLVGVDRWTSPIIKKYEADKLRKKILEALAISYEGKEVEQVFSENITSEEFGETTIYKAGSGSVAFEVDGPGSQGPIRGVMALGPDLEMIVGITIISQSETPGLGMRVLAPDNLAKFRGKTTAPRLLIVPSSTAVADNEVDAVTGATLTCKALESIVNSEAKSIALLIRGDGE